MKIRNLLLALLLILPSVASAQYSVQSIGNWLQSRQVVFVKNHINPSGNVYSQLKSLIESRPYATIIFDSNRTYTCQLGGTANAGIDIKFGQRLIIPTNTQVNFSGSGSNQYGFWAKGGVHGWSIEGGGKVTFDSLSGYSQTNGQYGVAISVGNYATGQGCSFWSIKNLAVETDVVTNGSIFITGNSRDVVIENILADTSTCGAIILAHWGGADSAIAGTGPTYHPHNISISNIVGRQLTTVGANAIELAGCFNITIDGVQTFGGGGFEATVGDFGFSKALAGVYAADGNTLQGQGITVSNSFFGVGTGVAIRVSGKGDISQLPAAWDSVKWDIPVTFTNVHVFSTGATAVSLQDCDGVQFVNCTFDGLASATNGIVTGQNVDNLKVLNSKFVGYQNYGLVLSYSDSIPINPLVTGCFFSGNNSAGITCASSGGTIAYNSFGDSALAASEDQAYAVILSGAAQDVLLIGNRVSNTLTGGFSISNVDDCYAQHNYKTDNVSPALYAGAYTQPLSITHSPFKLPNGAVIESESGSLTIRSGNGSSLFFQSNGGVGASARFRGEDTDDDFIFTEDSARFDKRLKIGPAASITLVETGGGADSVAIKAPASISASWTFTLPGAAPSSATTEFLRGDGTWAVPSGGSGDITSVGSMTSGDAFAGSAANGQWHGLGNQAGRAKYIDSTGGFDVVALLQASVQFYGTDTTDIELVVKEDTVRSNVPLAIAGSAAGSVSLTGSSGTGAATLTAPGTVTSSWTVKVPNANWNWADSNTLPYFMGFEPVTGTDSGLWRQFRPGTNVTFSVTDSSITINSSGGGGGSGTNEGKVLSVDSSGAAGNVFLSDTDGVHIVDRGRLMSIKNGGVAPSDKDTMYLDNEFPLDTLGTKDSVAFWAYGGGDTMLVISNKGDTTVFSPRDNNNALFRYVTSFGLFAATQRMLYVTSAGNDTGAFMAYPGATPVIGDSTDGRVYIGQVAAANDSSSKYYLPRSIKNASNQTIWTNGTIGIFWEHRVKTGDDSTARVRLAAGTNLSLAATNDTVRTLSLTGPPSATSLDANELLLGNGSSAITSLNNGTSSQVLTGGTPPAWGGVTSAMITDGTIAAGDIGTGAVTSTGILDGTVALGDLASTAVDSTKIPTTALSETDMNWRYEVINGTVVPKDLTPTDSFVLRGEHAKEGVMYACVDSSFRASALSDSVYFKFAVHSAFDADSLIIWGIANSTNSVFDTIFRVTQSGTNEYASSLSAAVAVADSSTSLTRKAIAFDVNVNAGHVGVKATFRHKVSGNRAYRVALIGLKGKRRAP